MVDKALFIDTGAAKNAMRHLEMLSNNLANVNTVGFRADYSLTKSAPVKNNDNESRVYSTTSGSYSDFNPGPISVTGRDLDVALNGKGFITVQNKNGEQAFTRAGNLQVKNGFLTTQNGEFVFGASGMISVPDKVQRMVIGPDGTFSVRIAGQSNLVPIDRIRLSNPDIKKLSKGADGLFHLPDGETARQDDSIRLTPMSLEGSNVNAVQTLTELVELSRRFEFHTHLIKNFQENSGKANQLLSIRE